MEVGVVKWFNVLKGFADMFVLGGKETDIFAHYSAIEMDGYRSLKNQSKVNFEAVQMVRKVLTSMKIIPIVE